MRLILAIANWYAYLTGQKTTEDAIAPAGILCDVRDVAMCHVKALLLPEAGGQRFGIATSASLTSSAADDRDVQHSSTARRGQRPRACRTDACVPQGGEGPAGSASPAHELVRLFAITQDP